MRTVEFRSLLSHPAEEVFAWHAQEGAFERLVPPWAPVRLDTFEGIGEGDRVVLRIGPGSLSLRWVAEHYDVIEGRQFCDRQVQGPFAQWEHRHRFEPSEEKKSEETTLVDRITFALPGGLLGTTAEPWVESELRRQFAYRHRVTRRDLDLHQHYNSEGHSLTVAVSGTSGLIGSQLVPFLTTGGHSVKRLVRLGPTADDEILWNPRTGTVETEKLEGVDAVIHLAGENVFGLWTEAKKRRIYESRVQGTHLLANALASLDRPPEVFISASGVGYYGHHGSEIVTEESEPRHQGFLSTVCQDWEAATEPASAAGIRTVLPRIGGVLTPAGGALKIQLPVFWAGLGGPVGPTDQYVPWIGLDDVLGGLYHLLWTDALEGPVNLTVPTPVTMEEYTRTIADLLHRPARFHLSSSLLQTVVGEAAEEMVLKSARVVPDRLLESGYNFGHETLFETLRHELGRTDTPFAEGTDSRLG